MIDQQYLHPWHLVKLYFAHCLHHCLLILSLSSFFWFCIFDSFLGVVQNFWKCGLRFVSKIILCVPKTNFEKSAKTKINWKQNKNIKALFVLDCRDKTGSFEEFLRQHFQNNFPKKTFFVFYSSLLDLSIWTHLFWPVH